MLTGVEILLERMKTNPEEFIEGGFSKWSRVIDRAWEVLNEEERTALQDGTRLAKREHFNGEVMRVLADGHDDRLGVAEDYDRIANTYTTSLAKNMAITKNNITSSLLTPEVMKQQVQDALDKQFDEAYARKDTKTMKVTKKLKDAMRK